MNIQEQINLKPYNSFQLDCVADYFCEIESSEEFEELATTEIYNRNPVLFLWWGSNILLTSNVYKWIVVKNEIRGKKIIEENDESVTIKVWAGENRNSFVEWSLDQWYCWCENLISIPWTVWAAPMQNIWAYGAEIKDMIMNVQWFDLPSNTEIILAKYECKFGYRESIFKHDLKDKFFITHVTITLKKYRPSNYFPQISYGAIQQKLEEMYWDDNLDIKLTPTLVATTIAKIRASKLPDWKKIWTAGSFFKNPIVSKEKYKKLQSLDPTIKWYPLETWEIKLNAGQLIDLAGLKWLQHGNVWTYHKHALVLVNHGNWTWEELVELSARIQKIVKQTFDIEITPEVNFI